MSGTINKSVGITASLILTVFVIISFTVSHFCVMKTGLKYQRSLASSALDFSASCIDADFAKECYSTRIRSDEYEAVQNKLKNYREKNRAVFRRISLVSFTSTAGTYIYDTDGQTLGARLDYSGFNSKSKAELINGRTELENIENGCLTVYRPLRTVEDNLAGWIIVEMEEPYENAYFMPTLLIFISLWVISIIFVFILCFYLSRKFFRPIRQITESAMYLSGDDSVKEGRDSSVLFATNRDDEIGRLSMVLQKILLNINSGAENLSKALYDANHDGMTQLLNKRCYHSMEERFRSCASICLIYFDVNNLKLMNDTLGHESGDNIIKRASDYVKALLGDSEYCFRMGGDEFLMVMTDCTMRRIDSVVTKLDSDCPYILNRGEDKIISSLSYGYAYAKGDYSYDELLSEAENNMYIKKAEIKGLLNMPDR